MIILSASSDGLRGESLESIRVVTRCPAALKSEIEVLSIPYPSLRMFGDVFLPWYPPAVICS